MTEWGSSAALAGLVVEAVEWLPSGAESGLVRVRARWVDAARREADLPALGLRRGGEARHFDSLPDARFGRDPAVWRGTYLVPAALMDPAPDELWLSWESGARAALPAPARSFEPPATAPVPAPPPEPEGEVIDRAVLAERRARRAEAAERAQAERAAEALKAVEVLELRSAELERRLEAVQAAEPEPAPVVEVGPHPAEAALADALTEIKRLRFELAEQRDRLRRSELLRAADAVALASFREEKGRVRRLQAELALRERELADAVAAREQAIRRAADDAAAHAATRAELARRERELGSIGAELTGVRAELATVRSDAERRAAMLERRLSELDAALESERRAHAATTAALQTERNARAATAAALESERRAHGATATERETARAGLTLVESARTAEAVARAALDEELDRERAARAALTAARDAAIASESSAVDRAASAEATARELAAARDAAADRAASAEATARELVSARDAAAASESSARAELAAAVDRVASAEAAARGLAAARDAAVASESSARAALAVALQRAASAEAASARLAAAQNRIAELEQQLERETGGLLGRIAELERAADDDLARRAREQTEAAAAVDRVDAPDVAANLDAAAAALRARPSPAPASTESEEAAAPAEPAAPSAPVEAPPSTEAPAAEQPAVAAPPPAGEPPAKPARARPTIVTESKHPPRADVVGSSKRQYPWLRGALVKLAHDDPRAATRLVLGLVPVQRELRSSPLEYDLTIRDSGTYAVSIGETAATARSIGEPRPRGEASFHASADIVTLAELLAGVEKRMGRWIGSVKVHGRRRDAEALKTALAAASLDLAAAARAGADLDPDLVFRAFAYAIHPSWTKGHEFTVAQELAGPQPQRWHVAIRDGKPVTVERRAPANPADAVVSMTRAAFSHLLRGEHPPAGERPTIRGDRAAVALLKGWTDRAQGRVSRS